MLPQQHAPVQSTLESFTQARPKQTHIHAHILGCVCVCVSVMGSGGGVVYVEAKQIERLISTKASPIDLCTGKWNNGCPTGRCRSRAASWALPALFQCKRQPNVCPQLESLCESTADYVGISVVVSHKYARTQAHTQTNTHTHTLTYSMVSSKWAEP